MLKLIHETLFCLFSRHGNEHSIVIYSQLFLFTEIEYMVIFASQQDTDQWTIVFSTTSSTS